MKKTLIVVLSLITILSLISGCTISGGTGTGNLPSGSSSGQEVPGDSQTESKEEERQPVTIEFLCWGAAEAATADAFKAMVDGFIAKYQWITVDVTESNYDAVSTTLLTRAAAKSAPDTAQVSNQWVAALKEMDALIPVDEILSAETMNDYYAGAKSGTTINGKVYSAPWIIQPICMFYNKDLLKAAGFSEPPKSWTEYIDMCYAIAKLGTNAEGNTVYGRSLASTVLPGAGYFTLIDVWANGGDFSDADGNITFYSEGTVAAYKELQEMVKQGVIAPGLQIVDNRSLFGNGQIGFHFDAPSQTATFSKVNFGVVQAPGGQSFSSDHHLVAFADTDNAEECGLFIDYLTGPEGMKLYTDNSDVICARHSVENLEYYKNLDSNMEVFFRAASTIRSLPVQSSKFLQAMEEIAEGLQRVVINMEDPDTVISDVNAKLKTMYGQ